MDEPQAKTDIKINLKLAFFGGSGIGLLFGIIMGTSTTPTVSVVLGSLTALLTALLGLNDTYFNDAKSVRIGSFGFACVLGIFIGFYVRSNNPFSPTIEQKIQAYQVAGFSQEQALKYIAAKEFGFYESTPSVTSPDAPSQRNSEEPAASQIQAQLLHDRHSNVLFGADVELSSCEELRATDQSLPPNEIVNNFEIVGGNWQKIASKLSLNLHGIALGEGLLKVKNAICANKDGAIKDDHCEALNKLNASSSLDQIKTVFADQSSIWHSISNTDTQGYDQRQQLLAIRDALCSLEH